MARTQTSRPELAEEIAQEALLRAWRYRERLRDPELFFSWLFRIVRNEAARVSTRVAPEPVEGPPEIAAEDECLTATPVRLDVERSILRLGPLEQLLVRLRYEDDLTQAAIAAKLEMPEGSVKVALHRARHKLRAALSDDEQTQEA